MSSSAAIAEPASVKGWCPGALRPMQTGDGLIVRVRPRCGALSVSQMLAVSEVARRHGNGLIDLTRRANLQIRGVDARDLPSLWAALSECGLIDAHADAEAVRNVMVIPLTGIDATEVCDVRPIAARLEAALAETPALWALPGKFGFVVDGGGLLSLDGERADIRLKAFHAEGGIRIAIGIDTTQGTQWLRLLDPEATHAAAVRLATAFVALPKSQPRARMRDLDPSGVGVLREVLARCGAPAGDLPSVNAGACKRVGLIETRGSIVAVGVGAPFGRLTVRGLTRIAETAAELGVAAFRLSPWRVLYAPVTGSREASILLDTARAGGLVTAADDPLLAIDACPGAPACRSASADTRAVALRIAAMMPLPGVTSVHVSGCAKGCARSRAADLVLVAGPKGLGIVRNGSAAASPNAFVAPDDLHDLPAILRPGG
ncbi:precorrin-3B synthase [Hyphomicrobium sp.]|uniref:precorrin-3B synthase n=1 Tax=Hyphomicrobium sp. TaxID=82 RepID=UPI0025B8D57D|nr:precorrin-3B synthase [Hyphomicrobium sp.]MCC7252912.1 precorrin-3B synthase [Hyphomicrobium sp.]